MPSGQPETVSVGERPVPRRKQRADCMTAGDCQSSYAANSERQATATGAVAQGATPTRRAQLVPRRNSRGRSRLRNQSQRRGRGRNHNGYPHTTLLPCVVGRLSQVSRLLRRPDHQRLQRAAPPGAAQGLFRVRRGGVLLQAALPAPNTARLLLHAGAALALQSPPPSSGSGVPCLQRRPRLDRRSPRGLRRGVSGSGRRGSPAVPELPLGRDAPGRRSVALHYGPPRRVSSGLPGGRWRGRLLRCRL